MEKVLTSASRPGSFGFSLAVFSGLVLLAAALWDVAPGYVLLLFVPALLLCLYQMVAARDYGLSLDDRRWRVTAPGGSFTVAAADIAHLRIARHDRVSRATLVLRDGSAVAIPFDLAPDARDLMQAATAHGIEVRAG